MVRPTVSRAASSVDEASTELADVEQETLADSGAMVSAGILLAVTGFDKAPTLAASLEEGGDDTDDTVVVGESTTGNGVGVDPALIVAASPWPE